jgi:hypothetical protein
LQASLHAAQFDTWRDVHNLRAGDRWPRKLGDAIAEAPSFILVWSAAAALSDFVELEWTIAVALKRTICIVALDQSLVPATLKPFQAKRTTDDHEAAEWLLNRRLPLANAAGAGAQPVLERLSATSDRVPAKQIANSLNTMFLNQAASNVQGSVYQSTGPMYVYQGDHKPAAPAFRSNISARFKLPFVGREDLMEQIDSLLEDPGQESVVVLHGAPGVGKSELAREFARLRRQRYPGGTFAIDASSNAFALQLASVGEKLLALQFPPEMKFDDRGLRTFLTLSQEPVLLIYDNVVSFEQAQPWLPYSGMTCHVLMTTLVDRPTHTWSCLEVDPLTPGQSLELVDRLTDGKLDRPTAQSVAKHSGGLPVQILPHAAAIDKARRRGRKSQSQLPIVVEAGNSFRAAYGQLEPSARLLLHTAAFFNTQHIPSEEVTQHLMQGLGWTEAEVERAFDGCYDLHLLQDPPDPRMHQLFAAFIRETALGREEEAALAQVVTVQVKRFLELAGRISANPADLTQVALLLDYPLTPDVWTEMGAPVAVEDGELAGSALYQVGRFEEARSWFERAVADKTQGDMHGRVDHESLGSSLHQVGDCHGSTGRFEEARPWFERAAAKKAQGDVHGRVDHESLGSSLHQWATATAARGILRKRGRGLSAPWRRRKRATCTGAWTTTVWDSA